jgi:hypothetical protein
MAKTPNIKLNLHHARPAVIFSCRLAARQIALLARLAFARAMNKWSVGLALPLSRLHRPADLSFTLLASESQILASFKLSRSSLNYPTPCNYSFRIMRRQRRSIAACNYLENGANQSRPIDYSTLSLAFWSSNGVLLLRNGRFKLCRSDWTLKVISVNELELESWSLW